MDIDRRNFLKIILIGSGALLVEKVLGPLFSEFSDNSSTKNNSTTFQVIEDKKSLSIYDSSGEEVLQIDKKT